MTGEAPTFVSYVRVSTQRQGQSGLGLEAQRAAVDAYVAGRRGRLLQAFTEVESGRKVNRPELARAVAFAKATRSVLVVAKMDRLARNAHFLSSLMADGLEFVACDFPQANRLMVQILAAVAEWEVETIRERCRAAAAAYKARGGKMGAARPGGWKFPSAMGAVGNRAAQRVHAANAAKFVSAVRPLVSELRAEGKSWAEVADALNARGVRTRRGKVWTGANVEAFYEFRNYKGGRP